LPSSVSDYSSMVVKVVGDDQNIKKPFKFFDMWWIMISSCSSEESLGLEFGGLNAPILKRFDGMFVTDATFQE